MRRLKPTDTEKIVAGLQDDSGLILGLENDSLAEILNGASSLDVWASNIFKDSNSTEANFLRALYAVPDENMHGFLTELLDYANLRASGNKLSLKENAVKDIKAICAKFKDVKPQAQPAPLAEGAAQQAAPRVGWDQGKVNAYVNRTFNELMIQPEMDFNLPRFQRAYSWEREQLSALWDDLLQMRQRHEPHFMGFIVLRRISSRSTEILDGQQRFITMSLLVLAALNRLNRLMADNQDTENNEGFHQTLHRIVVPFRENRQDIRPRLRLGQDRSQYDQMVYDQNGWEDGAADGNIRLFQAFQYFESKFAAFSSGKEIYKFITDMNLGTYFTELTVEDTHMAYKLFDTINNRGMHLSYIDIVKNHLFNLAEPHNEMFVDDALRRWDEMILKLGQLPFKQFFQAVLSRYPEGNGTHDLLEKMQGLLAGPMSTIDIVQELSRNTKAYLALTGKDNNYWQPRTIPGKEIMRSIDALDTLNVTNHLGIALAAQQAMPMAAFAKFMRRLVVMAVRHLVVYGNANGNLGKVYADLAVMIFKANPGILRIRSELIECCPDNSRFRDRFADFKVVRNLRLAKYIMAELEHVASGRQWSDPDLTLEHVLPQKNTVGWSKHFDRHRHPQHVHRVGNFALLSEADNNKVGQADFETKKAVLAKSNITINKRIAKYRTWDPQSMDAHQEYLADLAVQAWRL